MSILTLKLKTPEKEAAEKLIKGIQSTKRAVIGELRHNFNLLWDNPNPQGVLDELGANAAEVFQINSSFVQFVISMLMAAGDTESVAEIQRLVSKIPPHTINEDGTVTINYPEPPVMNLDEWGNPVGTEYERDSEGNVVLDENGQPTPIWPELDEWGNPVGTEYERDSEGNVVLDENGMPSIIIN
jgi:hypothetical protein